MLRASLLGIVLLGAACRRDSSPPSPSALLSTVRTALAERDKRFTSFAIEVDTVEGERHAHHTFAFRSPNRSRGHVTMPQELEVAFDGTTLRRVTLPAGRVEVIDLDLPVADRALALASMFMPFAPEGFRTPLMPSTGVEARSVKHPKAPEAVELVVSPEKDVRVTYVLRLPSGDFLEKRTETGGETRVLTVDEESCDAALRLCVPVKLTERVGAVVIGTTQLTRIELNPELPEDHFRPGN